jgi:hypothetical protein
MYITNSSLGDMEKELLKILKDWYIYNKNWLWNLEY